jgi:hypothetical protein
MIRYVFYTSVLKVSEQFQDTETWRDSNGQVHVNRVSLGWFVRLAGSQEQIHVGCEKPELRIGDTVKITLERAEIIRTL